MITRDREISVFTPILENMVAFLHLLVAIDKYHTPYKFGFRSPNFWDLRKKIILANLGDPILDSP